MGSDREGFLYPVFEEDKCIDCDACEKVCPIINSTKEKEFKQKAYIVQHKDDGIRRDSSAGGAFTAIATTIIQRGGVVFGAAYDENFQVLHTYVETIDNLYKFRNSKYVQSHLGNCFGQTKKFLIEGRWVCFSGTPCQIEGLYSFLGKTYEKLVLVDVVCHGIPSPLIWNKYLEYQKIHEKQIDNICFRDKYYGYKYSTMSMIRNNKNVYHAGSQMDPMLRAFFSDICDRPSCYDCKFKKHYRLSDFTIWDCFTVRAFDKKLDDDKGTTRVLIHTPKGKQLFEEIKTLVICKEIDPFKLVYGVKEMFESVTPNVKRTPFFEDAKQMDGRQLFQKYFPITTEVRIKTTIRKVILRLGMYSFAKDMIEKVRGR